MTKENVKNDVIKYLAIEATHSESCGILAASAGRDGTVSGRGRNNFAFSLLPFGVNQARAKR
jgi:hypothetical protein